MSPELHQLIQEAYESEMRQDPLPKDEREKLVLRIMKEDNIDSTVSHDEVYEDYVIQGAL